MYCLIAPLMSNVLSNRPIDVQRTASLLDLDTFFALRLQHTVALSRVGVGNQLQIRHPSLFVGDIPCFSAAKCCSVFFSNFFIYLVMHGYICKACGLTMTEKSLQKHGSWKQCGQPFHSPTLFGGYSVRCGDSDDADVAGSVEIVGIDASSDVAAVDCSSSCCMMQSPATHSDTSGCYVCGCFNGTITRACLRIDSDDLALSSLLL